MNIHEHGFKHGAGHSRFCPAQGKTTARRNRPNLWQMIKAPIRVSKGMALAVEDVLSKIWTTSL